MLDRKPNLVLIGGGGHCMSVIDVVEEEAKYQIKGILDTDTTVNEVLGYPVLGDDNEIENLIDENTFFIITVGQIKSYRVRKIIADKLDAVGAKKAKIISPHAYVSKHAYIEEGTVLMHDVIVNAGARIGKHCIVNTKSNIEHGAYVGDFCHISTCAVVNGDASIGSGTFVGSNATISNSIKITENSIISAGDFIKK